VKNTICVLSAILSGNIKIMINLYARKVKNLIGVLVKEVSIISINLMQIWSILKNLVPIAHKSSN
jgi:hypothetical protein